MCTIIALSLQCHNVIISYYITYHCNIIISSQVITKTIILISSYPQPAALRPPLLQPALLAPPRLRAARRALLPLQRGAGPPPPLRQAPARLGPTRPGPALAARPGRRWRWTSYPSCAKGGEEGEGCVDAFGPRTAAFAKCAWLWRWPGRAAAAHLCAGEDFIDYRQLMLTTGP